MPLFEETCVSTLLRPATEWELALMVADAANARKTIEILGSGSKRELGRPVEASSVMDLQGMRGIPLYEPLELVMRTRPGTRVAEIEKELALRRQMLAFEPIDTTALFGTGDRSPTIGGVFATNLSGSRRIATGSARDHLIGIRAVTGQAECIASGGRVLKNVTGYDVGRALAGSHGTLAVITEVTFKVMPRPEATRTLLLGELPDELAVEALCAAMTSPYEVTGAVHVAAAGAARMQSLSGHSVSGPLTAIRLEAFDESVRYRTERLKTALAHFGEISILETDDSLAFWQEIRHLHHLLNNGKQLWRISVTPTIGPKIVSAIGRYMDVEASYDWSGGLVWLLIPASKDAGVTDIRRVIALYGGHATLFKAEADVRARMDVFQPLDPGIERLTLSLKHAFDPYRVFNPGRMHAAI